MADRPNADIESLDDLARYVGPVNHPAPERRDPLECAELWEAISRKAVQPRVLRSRMSDTEREARRKENEAHQRRAAVAHARSAMAKQLGPRYSPERATLEAFAVYSDRQKPVLERLRKLRAEIGETVKAGRNVVFFGTVGTGKDHLAAALLYAATEAGCLCRYTNGRDLFARFRATMGDDAAENERKLVDDFAATAVLAISDPTPPGSDMTPWQQDVLYRIVDRRYSLLRSTWITANLTRETADAALTEPVWDRLQENAEFFLCDWGSYRERKK